MDIEVLPRILLAAVLAAGAAACSDAGGGESDAGEEETPRICDPGVLRCDPDGSQWIQQCNEDGTGWNDVVECGLCHDGQCW